MNSSTAGIINATTPLWTVVLALTVRHRRSVTTWQGAGLIVGFGGAVLIFSPWDSAGGLASAGALECLAASVSYAISYIYMDRYLAQRGMSPVTLSACQLLAAAVMLAIALAASGARTPHFTAVSVTSLVILGVRPRDRRSVCAELPDHHQRRSDHASTVTYLLPVVAIGLGVVVLGESVTVMVLAGIALVLAGVALTHRHAKTDAPH